MAEGITTAQDKFGKHWAALDQETRERVWACLKDYTKAFYAGQNVGRIEGLRRAEEIAKTPISKLYGMDVMRKYDEIAEAIRAEREKLEGEQ